MLGQTLSRCYCEGLYTGLHFIRSSVLLAFCLNLLSVIQCNVTYSGGNYYYLQNVLSYFKKVNDSHKHNKINNTLSFKVRFRRTSKKALSICIKGSKMWNALSPDIKLSSNANAFKKMLKSSLLEDYKF